MKTTDTDILIRELVKVIADNQELLISLHAYKFTKDEESKMLSKMMGKNGTWLNVSKKYGY